MQAVHGGAGLFQAPSPKPIEHLVVEGPRGPFVLEYQSLHLRFSIAEQAPPGVALDQPILQQIQRTQDDRVLLELAPQADTEAPPDV